MKTEVTIQYGNTPPAWSPCPINPDWILEKNPVARIEHLSSSADGTASSYYWECTAGRFNWYYSFDETLHVLEGSVLLKFRDGTSHQVSAGDTVFFPAGSAAEWTVDKYIRKLAFCRTPLPSVLISVRSILRWFKRLGVRGNGKRAGQGMFPTQ